MFARNLVVGSMAAALLGCGGSSMSNEQLGENELAAMEQKTSSAEPLGTYKMEAPQAGDLSLLVLMSDGRFHAEQVVYCLTTPCEPAPMDGTYVGVSNNFSRQLKLFNAEGELVSTYQYAYDGETLNLRGEGEWQTMAPSVEAWCAQIADCQVQGIVTPACEGNWHCHPVGCMYHVSTSDGSAKE
jgi:hypothetical protein